VINKIDWFKKIFEEFYSPLCNYAFKITGNKEEAEDIVQSLFIKFWESPEFNKIGKIERYLLRSVKFKSIDYLRRKNKTQQIQLIDIHDNKLDSGLEFSESDIEPLLAYFAAKLPPKTREVFLLSRKSKKTYKQIAEELNISIKTVESQMGRALKQMRNLLKEHGFLSLIISL